ncbi:MAG: molybdopterin-dependent oxidoreductase, partial [Saprospiraceae bacterium]|nr:molybdopterin-dependent oxidoreductase [Saprospiraceae bacterium]
TEPGLVKHETSGRSMSFGEIATFAKAPDHLPEITLAELKSPDQFRLIGKEMPRYDIPSKVDGSAIYSMDVQIPDMVYGVVTRSPVHGSKPTLLNEEEIRELEGVVDLMVFDHGIGVVTKKFGQAIKAKRQLQIRWSKDAQASDYNSLEAYSLYQEISNNKDTSWHQIESEGSLGSLLSDASDVFDASYQNDYVYHAQMEPLNAVVSPSGDGQSAEAWVGSQAQASARTAVADALGIKTENVKLHPCYLGGGFGRRSMSDYVTEAAKLAGQVKKPVKLIWTREDDLQYGAFRPICLQKMQAKVDSKGVIEAWSHRIIGTGGGLLASGARVPYYTMEAKRIEVHSVEHGVRTKHWRSVGHGPNKFAIEAFLDEIAHQKGLDPYVWRRDLMKNDLRSLAVLDTVAEMSNWNSVLDQDRARGIAFVERSGALAAGVAEISVNQETGMIKVHRFWSAVDAGIVVQPNNAIAQMEGGIVFGISSVLHESITFKNGKVQQSNFHDYPLSRMADTPELIEVKLIQSTEKPSGIGEASTPLVGGAIANAFLALTGKAIRHMPFTSGRVLELLS